MICIEDIRHRILDISQLSIDEGITVIIGPNGAGKSTFLRLCAGVEVAENGSVLIDNTFPRGTDIGWVDENPERTLLFERAIDEIASTLRFQGMPCPEIQTRVHTIIEQLGISSLLTGSTWNLSAGEKVLVALGAALAGNPQALILDEVDSHLDPIAESRLHTVLSGSGIRYILISTQHMETAAEANWVIYLEKGRVLHHGAPEEVFPHLQDTCFYPESWRSPG
jgi:energy-coupling factor transporter ATP-binding protein EcfA2